LTLEKFILQGLSEQNLKHLEKMNSDPVLVAKRLENLKKYNSNEEARAKNTERFKAYLRTE